MTFLVNPSVFSSGAGSPTTWNPLDKDPVLSLSSGDLTVTHPAGADVGTAPNGVRATNSRSSGKRYFELTCVSASQNQNVVGIGLITSPLTFPGDVTGSYGVYGFNGWILFNNAQVGTATSWTTGSVVSVAVDLDAGKLWFRTGSGVWNNSGANNPATGVGGLTISTGAYYPMFGCDPSIGTAETSSVVATANFGASSFSSSIPSGFSSWDTP